MNKVKCRDDLKPGMNIHTKSGKSLCLVWNDNEKILYIADPNKCVVICPVVVIWNSKLESLADNNENNITKITYQDEVLYECRNFSELDIKILEGLFLMGYRYIARDYDDGLYAYAKKPNRRTSMNDVYYEGTSEVVKVNKINNCILRTIEKESCVNIDSIIAQETKGC